MSNSEQLEKYHWKKRIILLTYSDVSNKKVLEQRKIFEQTPGENKERKLILIEKVKEDIEFKLDLIGLDGGVKKSFKNIVPMKDLFKIIDSMPMRASELKKPR